MLERHITWKETQGQGTLAQPFSSAKKCFCASLWSVCRNMLERLHVKPVTKSLQLRLGNGSVVVEVSTHSRALGSAPPFNSIVVLLILQSPALGAHPFQVTQAQRCFVTANVPELDL